MSYMSIKKNSSFLIYLHIYYKIYSCIHNYTYQYYIPRYENKY